MQQQFSNFKEFFKSIRILHAAMFFGMVMILIILKFVLGINDTSDGGLLYPAIGIGLAISSLVFGHKYQLRISLKFQGDYFFGSFLQKINE